MSAPLVQEIDDMADEKMKSICLKARECRDKMELAPEQYLCKEVSIAICYAAAEAGLIPCLCFGRFAVNKNKQRDHYWVRINSVIYDATADQFDEKLARVHVVRECDDTRYIEDGFVIFNSTAIDILKSMK